MKTKMIDQKYCFVIENDFHQKSLDDFFDFYCISKKNRHLLRMNHKITLNQKPIQHNPILQMHDELILDAQIDEEMDFLPQEMDLKILYEDDFILIVDKPVGYIIHPEDKNQKNTLVNGISAYYQKTNQKHAIRYIHRLDKETSGCILFSKQPFFQAYLDHAMATKQIQRTYLALVEGILDKQMTLSFPIAKDRHVSNKYRIAKQGVSAITHITPLIQDHNITLIQCVLDTGRTHQIRVHCAAIHHPLCHDLLYGKKSPLISRCALHSYSIEFIHPFTLEKIKVISSLPQDMKQCLKHKKTEFL